MKLSLFKVQNFRSIWNSGWVSCQDVTALAGVNEAGKSNLLKALWKLKPAFKADNKIVHSDLPRDKFDEIMDSEELPTFITAKFRLEPNDTLLIRKAFPDIKPFDSCLISRSLSGKYTVEVPVDIPETDRDKLCNLLIRIMPGFIYYSNYGNLDSNIYLPQMIAKFNKSGVNALTTSKRRTIKLLLMYIGITPEMLSNDLPLLSQTADTSKLSAGDLRLLAEKQEKYQQIFANAGARLSADFNRWWKQGKYQFDFSFDGDNLKIWVTDDKGNRAPLEQRSVGMQWFLSFFLVFSLESEFFYTNTILLLDESGMTLHSLAQKDLIHFFEKLAKKNQLIYTTHSSFMLPTEHLNRTKIIYKDKHGHSVVANDLSVGNTEGNVAALYPIQSAVGIDLSMNMLNGENAVIVLSNADKNYLTIIKNYMQSTGKFNSFNDLYFVTSGENGVDGMAQILSQGKVLPKVFLPADVLGDNMSKYLYRHAYHNDTHKVLCVRNFGNFTTLEDIIPYEFFAVGAGNYLANLLGTDFEIDLSLGFVQQVCDYADAHDITLPSNFRLELSNLVREYVRKNHKDIKLSRTHKKAWEDVIAQLTK